MALRQAEDLAEDSGHFVRGVGDLPVGEAEDAEAGGYVDLVSFRHPRLLGRGAVVAEAVGLDDQVVVGEPEVDFVAEDPLLRERGREVGGEGERPEQDLEV